MARARRGWGKVQRMRSGRWQATYTGPDGQRHSAPSTFDGKEDAEAWLVDERRLVAGGTWTSPKSRAKSRFDRRQTFATYADQWLAKRRTRRNEPIKDRTRAHYQSLLDRRILPTFGDLRLSDITPELVAAWFEDMEREQTPTMTAHAYSLMHAIMASAATPDGRGRALIPSNPCTLRGAQKADTARPGKAISKDELLTIIDNMAPKYRLIVAIMGWCGLRFGEAAALTRADLDTNRRIIHVRKGIVRVDGRIQVDSPKNRRSRDVAYPGHRLDDLIRQHLETFAEPGPGGKLFPNASGGYLAQSTLNGRSARVRRIKGRVVNESSTGFRKAVEAAGVPDLRLHDLRHTSGTLSAATGASLKEIMERHGHRSPTAAMRYQHAAAERDRAIADAL